jgi:hypothetical protein
MSRRSIYTIFDYFLSPFLVWHIFCSPIPGVNTVCILCYPYETFFSTIELSISKTIFFHGITKINRIVKSPLSHSLSKYVIADKLTNRTVRSQVENFCRFNVTTWHFHFLPRAVYTYVFVSDSLSDLHAIRMPVRFSIRFPVRHESTLITKLLMN